MMNRTPIADKAETLTHEQPLENSSNDSSPGHTEELLQKLEEFVKPILDFITGVGETTRMFFQFLRSGSKFGSKEMIYLYTLLVFQISSFIIDFFTPQINEIPQPWLFFFIVFKIAIGIAWLIWGGWLKKQLQEAMMANDVEKEQFKRDLETETSTQKEALNIASVENQKQKLEIEIKTYKIKNLEHDLELITAEKKDWKRKYYELESKNGQA